MSFSPARSTRPFLCAMLTAPARTAGVGLASLCLLAAAPAAAESLFTSASSAASSASSAGSVSLRGSSDSIENSSDSSRNENQVAEGDYRVAAIDAIAARPGMLRLTMEPVEAGTAGGFALVLPKHAVDAPGIAAGDLVSARHRPYGIEFARRDTRQAFFLVLADAWHRDLETRVIAN